MGGCHQPRSLAQKKLIFGKNFAEKRLNPEEMGRRGAGFSLDLLVNI